MFDGLEDKEKLELYALLAQLKRSVAGSSHEY
jgi:hypothetical protein